MVTKHRFHVLTVDCLLGTSVMVVFQCNTIAVLLQTEGQQTTATTLEFDCSALHCALIVRRSIHTAGSVAESKVALLTPGVYTGQECRWTDLGASTNHGAQQLRRKSSREAAGIHAVPSSMVITGPV